MTETKVQAYAWYLGRPSVERDSLREPSGPFDWPQWQGPDRNAVSKEPGLLKNGPKKARRLPGKIKGLGGGDGLPPLPPGGFSA